MNGHPRKCYLPSRFFISTLVGVKRYYECIYWCAFSKHQMVNLNEEGLDFQHCTYFPRLLSRKSTQHTTTIYLLSFMLDVQYRSYIATDDCLCLSSMHHRKLAHPSFFLDCLSRDIGIIPPLFSNITNYWLS